MVCRSPASWPFMIAALVRKPCTHSTRSLREPGAAVGKKLEAVVCMWSNILGGCLEQLAADWGMIALETLDRARRAGSGHGSGRGRIASCHAERSLWYAWLETVRRLQVADTPIEWIRGGGVLGSRDRFAQRGHDWWCPHYRSELEGEGDDTMSVPLRSGRTAMRLQDRARKSHDGIPMGALQQMAAE
jgi:hypothetical protein